MNKSTIAALVLLTSCAASLAQPPAPHGGPGPHSELSEAQQDKVFAIMHTQEPAARQLHKREHQAREALRAHAASGKFAEAAAAKLAAAAGEASAALLLHEARTQAQVDALLTPEQRRRAPPPHRPADY